MIHVENVSKFYGEHRAISDLSFHIGDGEVVGLLGLNGAGKSTILKVLGCFLTPSSGRATIQGFSVTEEPHRVREVIGYLPDTPPLYNEMTVMSYLRFVARLKNVPPNQVESRVNQVVARTNLEEVLTFRLGELSHGFRQRVGIAQSLVHNPRIVILDEPINGLDPVQIVEMRDLILGLKGMHTVILSSHILSEITQTCDKILVIDRGHLVAEGSEKKLRQSYSSAMKVRVQLAAPLPGGTDDLRQIGGITSATVQEANDVTELMVEADRDVRAELTAWLVQRGGRVLEVGRFEDGLENIFMKLIRSGHEGGTHG